MKGIIENSTILVTGGAGFVGSYVVEMLLDRKVGKVIIIDNMLRGSKRNMAGFINDPRVEFHEDDIRNQELMDRLVSSSDYVYHLAALRITRCAENQVEAFDVMANATFKLIELCKKHEIKKLIYSSTASVYGLAEHFPTPETDSPYDNKTFYGACKSFGEQMLRSYHDMHGLDYVALRYFNIFGPRMDTEGKYTEVMIKWLDCIRDERAPLIFGDGSTSMDFVYVSDIALANILALESDVTDEAFNVGYQRETSLKELLDIMLQVSGSQLKPKHRPDNTINPVSKRIADISKARKLLGFEPTVSLEDGLGRLQVWYKEIKGLVN